MSYNEYAKRWAKHIRSGNNLAHRFLEKPAMTRMLPDLTGKRVLVLGCGSGEEVDLLLAKGCLPGDLIAIDLAEDLIKQARVLHTDIDFRVADINQLSSAIKEEEFGFDFIYSSLTFHYLPSWKTLLDDLLVMGNSECELLFSTHHPVKWGSQVTRGDDADSFVMGYVRPKKGSPDVMGDYFTRRLIKDTWFGNFQVEYYHRSLQDIMNEVLESGWILEQFHEPLAIEEAKELAPEFYDIHSRIPLFMVFKLRLP